MSESIPSRQSYNVFWRVETRFTRKMFLRTFALIIFCIEASKGNCNVKLREKYCQDKDASCLSCDIGPKCQIPGNRKSPNAKDGTLLIRGKSIWLFTIFCVEKLTPVKVLYFYILIFWPFY